MVALLRDPEPPDWEPEVMPTAALGEEVVGLARVLDAGEYRFCRAAAVFDTRGGWQADGSRSPVFWLARHCRVAVRTAREKLRVGHELARRPLIDAAFASGRISYAQARAILRIQDADPDVDRALLALCDRGGSVADLERCVRHYLLLLDQDRPPDERHERRGVRTSRLDGVDLVGYQVMLTRPEAGELDVALTAAVDALYPRRSDSEARDAGLGGGEGSGPTQRPAAAQARADALMHLVRLGLASLGRPVDTSGADRYTLHMVATLDALAAHAQADAAAAGASPLDPAWRCELGDGEPITVEALRRLSCDCGIIRHIVGPNSEPLDVGRRSQTWPAAIRRAVTVRDRGRCRLGCGRPMDQIHHVVHWADHGPTCVGNGCGVCWHCHHLVHEKGWTLTGDANGTLVLTSPDGQHVSHHPVPTF